MAKDEGFHSAIRDMSGSHQEKTGLNEGDLLGYVEFEASGGPAILDQKHIWGLQLGRAFDIL